MHFDIILNNAFRKVFKMNQWESVKYI